MSKYPEINAVYDHYKGGSYRILFLSKYSVDDQILVNYQSLEFGTYHSRPLKEFSDKVTNEDSICVGCFKWVKRDNK